MKDFVESVLAPTTADDYVPGHGDPSYDVAHYDVRLDYSVSGNRLAGRVSVTAQARQDLHVFDLDLRGLRASKVRIDGFGVDRFSHRRGKLHVRPRRAIGAEALFVVHVTYAGRPEPVSSRWGSVGWEELADGALVAAQPSGAPSWFPCNDRPSDKASYAFAITTDSDYTVVANGILAGRRRRASTTTWSYEQVEPMATYLATVQIGLYAIHSTTDGEVEQRYAVPPALRAAADAEFVRQSGMLEAFTRMFGAYPFATYTVVVTADDLEIPLEAQGISIFGANHLDGNGGLERLVAHELAHQWFGNSLTVAQWRHIWLHEGFACYAEWLWSEEAGGATAHERAVAAWGRLAALAQDVVVGDPGPELMFDDRVYKRGALTLHAVRLTVGDDAFFDLLRGWAAAHRHGSVSTDAFVDHVEGVAGASVRTLFQAWLEESPLPELPASAEHS